MHEVLYANVYIDVLYMIVSLPGKPPDYPNSNHVHNEDLVHGLIQLQSKVSSKQNVQGILCRAQIVDRKC